MTVEHSSVSVVRDYPHARGHVFEAWADPTAKIAWLDLAKVAGSEWRSDFRIGGTERFALPVSSVPHLVYEGRYCDIVRDERIVLATEIWLDTRLASVTVVTAEFASTSTGTRLRCTETGAYLDGLDDAHRRESGIGAQLDALGEQLNAPPAR